MNKGSREEDVYSKLSNNTPHPDVLLNTGRNYSNAFSLFFSNLLPDSKISKSSQSQSFTEGKSYSKDKQTNKQIFY